MLCDEILGVEAEYKIFEHFVKLTKISITNPFFFFFFLVFEKQNNANYNDILLTKQVKCSLLERCESK